MNELEMKKLVIEGARYHSLPEDEVKKRYQEFLERLEREGRTVNSDVKKEVEA